MSWDVLIQKTNSKPVDDGHHAALGDAAEVRERLSAYFEDLEWLDPTWGLLLGDQFSLEFRLVSASPVEAITLHVRGGGDPVTAIARLCKHFQWQALDRATGQPLDLDHPTSQGWIEFQAFRQRVLKQYRKPHGQKA